MPKSRKEHICTLCHKTIPKGARYIYATITPWDHPDNDTFGTYKAHGHCDELWLSGIGKKMDWLFPASGFEWLEIILPPFPAPPQRNPNE